MIRTTHWVTLAAARTVNEAFQNLQTTATIGAVYRPQRGSLMAGVKPLQEDHVTCSTNKLQGDSRQQTRGIYIYRRHQPSVVSGPDLHTRQLVQAFRFVDVNHFQRDSQKRHDFVRQL